MNLLFQAAQEVGAFAAGRGWRYCVIGGLALLRWGEPRTTLDVDLSLLTGLGREEEFARALLERFQGRLPNTLDFALAHRVLLISASNGTDVDIAFAALPFEEEMVARATPFEFAPGIKLVTCSAEDLFITKAFAGRPRDWLDAEGIAVRQYDRLDKQRILKVLEALCELKEAPEILARARQLLEAES